MQLDNWHVPLRLNQAENGLLHWSNSSLLAGRASIADRERFEEKHRCRAKSGFACGFTLMELLIVISIILILMLMSVPTIGSMMKRANETSAVNSLRTIVTAEFMYANSYPKRGFACTLTAMSGDPASGPSSPDHAQLIESDLASGNKSGYVFTVKNCVKANNGASDYVKGYMITAVPETVGKTGDRGFCVDQDGGSPKYDPAGGTNCTQILLQ